jgi:hypothetical protein
VTIYIHIIAVNLKLRYEHADLTEKTKNEVDHWDVKSSLRWRNKPGHDPRTYRATSVYSGMHYTFPALFWKFSLLTAGEMGRWKVERGIFSFKFALAEFRV